MKSVTISGPLAESNSVAEFHKSGTDSFTDSETAADLLTDSESAADVVTDSDRKNESYTDPHAGLETPTPLTGLRTAADSFADMLIATDACFARSSARKAKDNCNKLRVAVSSGASLDRRANNTAANITVKILATSSKSIFHLFLLFRSRRRNEEADTESPIQLTVNKRIYRRKN